MLPDDRVGMGFSDAPSAALVEHGASDEFAIPGADDSEPHDGNDVSDSGVESERGEGERGEGERQWFGRFPAYPRNTPENLNTPDLTTRFYVGLWLPGAGALLTYALMRGNYWAAFVGLELLLVGWFTLAKL